MKLRQLAFAFVALFSFELVGSGCGGEKEQKEMALAAATACGTGALSLDAAPGYRAPGSVAITLDDCDLNSDAQLVQAASVTVTSTTDPVGFDVQLVETGPDTGKFQGSVQIDLVAQPGALLVANGDTITVAYADASDGTGNPANVVATAVVDNTSPDLSVTALGGPQSATAGETIPLTGTVANDVRGGGTNSDFLVSYYLRRNGSDTLLGSRWASRLAAGQSEAVDMSVAIPTNLAGGAYEIVAVVDSYGYVAESNERNNALAGNAIDVTGLALANLTVTAVGGPAAATAGDAVALTGTVANAAGGQPTYSDFLVSYYLRRNGSDTLVGSRWASRLAAGQSEPVDMSVTIPTNLAGGSYEIVLVADAYAYVPESNEDDNARVGSSVSVTGLVLANLTVTAVGGPAAATAGDAIALTGTVANAAGGQPTYSDFLVSFYLRRNGSDTLVGTRWASRLAAGQSEPADMSVTIPTNLAGGDYEIVLVADSYGYVPESNEGDNVRVGSSVAVTGLPLANLTVTSAGGPSAATAGDAIALTGTVANAAGGQPTYSDFLVSFYLRANGSDTLVGSRWASRLAAGQSEQVDMSVTIPTNLAGGVYQIVLVADSYGYVAESNEGDNSTVGSSVTVTGLPLADLTASSPKGPKTATAGEAITLTSTASNALGGQPTYSDFLVSYYLSLDRTLGSGDVLVGSRWASRLAAGQSEAVDMTVTIPTNLAGGGYYVIVVVDSYDYVPETNERNNDRVGSIITVTGIPLANLTATAVGGPDAASAGDMILLTSTIANAAGGQPTYSDFLVSFYLRANGSDTLVGSRWASRLAAGQSEQVDMSVLIPTNLAGGAYQVVAVADSYGYVPESNEGDNSGVGNSITVTGLGLANLTVTAVGGPSAATAGDTIALTGTVANAAGGQPTYSDFLVSYYLRGNGSDVLVGSRWASRLAAGQSEPVDMTVTVPTNLAGGQYEVVLVVDSCGYVVESREDDNALVGGPIGVTGLSLANLTVVSAAGPATATAGDTVALAGTVANTAGGQPTYSDFLVSYYLRGNGSDVLVGSRWASRLAAGQSEPVDMSVTIPTNLAGGQYQMVLVVDSYGYVPESNENDNAGTGNSVTVTGLPLANLTVPAVGGPAAATAGSTVTLTGTVANEPGAQPTYSDFLVSFYLRRNGVDVLVGSRWASRLAAGQSEPVDMSVTIPASLAAGVYDLLLVADSYGYIPESREDDNVGLVPSALTIQ